MKETCQLTAAIASVTTLAAAAPFVERASRRKGSRRNEDSAMVVDVINMGRETEICEYKVEHSLA